MATVLVPLQKGFKVGADVLREVVLREPTGGDIIDAQADSERLVYLLDGSPSLVSSPSMMGAHTLRRQVVRIRHTPGVDNTEKDVLGPLPLDQLKRFEVVDLNAIQAKANELDEALDAEAAAEAAKQRGRPAGDGGGPD